jgi:AAA+ superfamily predicted ATPase
MYLRNTSRNPIQIADYTFKVVDVNPISGGTTTSKDVTIKMLVTKN